jgi:RNA polymerase sigma factor (sigma-70 family)
MEASDDPPGGANVEREVDLESTEQLIIRARAGDPAALDRLVQRHAKPLLRWTSGRLPIWARDLADTDDLVQDALIQTIHRLDGFKARGRGALRAYLRQAVMNRLRDEIRRNARRPAHEALAGGHEDSGVSPLESAIGRETFARFRRAVATLRPEDRLALVGRIELGYTFEELAAAIGKPSAEAARKTATRALTRLVRQMRSTEAAGREPDPGRWRHLRLIECVGRSRNSQVYRAWDTQLDREVGLKLLDAIRGDSNADHEVVREGRLLARVRHPNVLTVYGVEEAEGRVGLWMEFIRGQTLAQRLASGGPFRIEHAVDVGVQVCRAVSAVHAAGVLHRDIKAQNVMRSDDGRVVLMDFGIGVMPGEEPATSASGTPLYMAPEVLRGEAASVQSDIYSIGALLWHLVTGEFPVTGATIEQLRLAHARGARLSLQTRRPDLPARFALLVDRALDPDPGRRHQNAAALESDLAPQVILVVPFETDQNDPRTDRLARILTDELIQHLGRIEGLQIRSAHAAGDVHRPAAPDSGGGSHESELVLGGAVRGSRKAVRVTAHLSRRTDMVRLWTTEGEDVRTPGTDFGATDRLVRSIADRVQLQLGAGPRRYDVDLETWQLHLTARALVDKRGVPNQIAAARIFEQVISRDRSFAPAYAGLAIAKALAATPFEGLPFADAYAAMRPAAERALELDAHFAEAHAAMGWVLAYERRWDAAAASFERALALDASLTQTCTSYSISTLQPLARRDRARALLQEARKRDPQSLNVLRELGEVELYDGRYQLALAAFRDVEAADPDYPFLGAYLGRALALAGKPMEAIERLERLDHRFYLPPSDSARPPSVRSGWLALPYVMVGRRAEAEALLQVHAGKPYRLAVIYAALGEFGKAIDALQALASVAPHQMGFGLEGPELRSLQDDSQIIALRRAFNLPIGQPDQGQAGIAPSGSASATAAS